MRRVQGSRERRERERRERERKERERGEDGTKRMLRRMGRGNK